MSLFSAFIGNYFRQLDPFGEDHLAIRIDVGGILALDGKRRMRAKSSRTFTADAHGEIGPLLDVFRPGVRVHRKPLGRQVVAHEEKHAARREDGEKADHLLFQESTLNPLKTTLDKRATAIIGEIAQRTESCLHTTPHQSLVEWPLVISAGVD